MVSRAKPSRRQSRNCRSAACALEDRRLAESSSRGLTRHCFRYGQAAVAAGADADFAETAGWQEKVTSEVAE